MTGVPVADLNLLVYITKKINNLDKILMQSKQFYDQDNLSFVVAIPQEFCKIRAQNILKTMNYAQTGASTSMATKVEDLIINNVTSLDDEAIILANDDRLNDWITPLMGAFESTVEIGSQYMSTHEIALKNKFKFYDFSLYKQKKPIASITLSLHDVIARIRDVGTMPEFQGKGYATHLVTYGLSEAKELGAQYCFLESSDL